MESDRNCAEAHERAIASVLRTRLEARRNFLAASNEFSDIAQRLAYIPTQTDRQRVRNSRSAPLVVESEAVIQAVIPPVPEPNPRSCSIVAATDENAICKAQSHRSIICPLPRFQAKPVICPVESSAIQPGLHFLRGKLEIWTICTGCILDRKKFEVVPKSISNSH